MLRLLLFLIGFGFGLFSVSFITTLFLKEDKPKERIEPSEYITLADCLEMYYYDDRRMIIENGRITDII